MIKKSLTNTIVITLLLLTSAVIAQDWTNWRGPNYNGSADEKNLPSAFSKTENVIFSEDYFIKGKLLARWKCGAEAFKIGFSAV